MHMVRGGGSKLPISGLSSMAVTKALSSVTNLLNNGWMDIYGGPRPHGSDGRPPEDAHVLASLHFGSPAFKHNANGSAEATAISPEDDAPRSGTAAWYRLTMSDHVTVVMDGSVGEKGSGASLTLDAVEVRQHARVSVGAFLLKMKRE